jgi:hypothetical protein
MAECPCSENLEEQSIATVSIHLFNKQLLNAYYMLEIVQGLKCSVMKNVVKAFVEGKDNKQFKK